MYNTFSVQLIVLVFFCLVYTGDLKQLIMWYVSGTPYSCYTFGERNYIILYYILCYYSFLSKK